MAGEIGPESKKDWKAYETSEERIEQARILAGYAVALVSVEPKLVEEALLLDERAYGRLTLFPGSEINILMDAMVILRGAIDEFKSGRTNQQDLVSGFCRYENSIIQFRGELERNLGKSLDNL